MFLGEYMKKYWVVFTILLILCGSLETKKRDCSGCRWCTKYVSTSKKKRVKKQPKQQSASPVRDKPKNKKASLKKEVQNRPKKPDPVLLAQQLITAIKDNKPIEVLEQLIDKGADIEYTDKEQNTPLHWAAAYAFSDAVELLLAHKADVFAKDYRGNTPLHLVAMYRPHPSQREKIAKFLLFEGATIYDRNDMGLNVLEVAATDGLRYFILITSFKPSLVEQEA